MMSFAAAATAFLVTAVVGKFLIPILRAMKAGQSIKEIGPNWHMTKQGTPTMGGIMFMVGITVAVLIFCWKDMMGGDYSALIVLGLALVTTSPRSRKKRTPASPPGGSCCCSWLCPWPSWP